MAIDSIFLRSEEFAGDRRSQILPPSLVRKTPLSAPATNTLELPLYMASARMELPCIAGKFSQLRPPSRVRKISPICWLDTLHAETRKRPSYGTNSVELWVVRS